MKQTTIENDTKDIFVTCPHCDNCEQHPIDEQRGHLQSFSVTDIIDADDMPNESADYSIATCLSCKNTIKVIWDYNNVTFNDYHLINIEYNHDDNGRYLYVSFDTFINDTTIETVTITLNNNGKGNLFTVKDWDVPIYFDDVWEYVEEFIINLANQLPQ
jgi:hypothetical protein